MDKELKIVRGDVEEISITRKDLVRYLAENIDNTNVIMRRGDTWIENIRDNKKYYMNGNCTIPGLVVFVVAAGPSLEKNIKELKRIPKYSKGMILALDAAFGYLMESGIIPDFCMSVDTDDRMWEMINTSEDIDTSDVTLLCSCSANPKVVSHWKGPRCFFNLSTTGDDFDVKAYVNSQALKSKTKIDVGGDINPDDFEILFKGIPTDVKAGGNVSTIAHSFAISKIGAWKVVAVGHDFSWSNHDNFYAGSRNKKMGKERANSCSKWEFPDVNGNSVSTNVSMWKYKDWHEKYNRLNGFRLVNATEGGILGVDQDGSLIEDIEFSTLKNAIDKYIFLEGINE